MTTTWSGPKLPPGVSATPKRKADGTITWYFYHKPTKTRLLQEPGTVAFAREVLQAAGGGIAEPVKGETLADICDKFERSRQHLTCVLETRLARERVLAVVRDKWGIYEDRHLSDRRFRGEVRQWHESMWQTPAKADKALETLQTVISWAEDRGAIEYNRLTKIKLLSPSRPRENCRIRPEQHAALMATGKPDEIRLYQFARLTGIRRADLCKVKWSDMDEAGWITWMHTKTAKKTKATSFYPTFAVPEFATLIETMPRVGETILTIDAGIPWSVGNINRRWDLWRERADKKFPGLGIIDIHWHDTRRSCIQDLLDAGCTDAQAASISGHMVGKNVDGSFGLYATRCRKLAEDAYRKLASSKAGDGLDPDNEKIVPIRRNG